MLLKSVSTLVAVASIALGSAGSVPRQPSDGYLHFAVGRHVAKGPSPALVERQSFQGTLVQEQQHSLYVINITVGTPTQSLAVQLDTGSSGLWVPTSGEISDCDSKKQLCPGQPLTNGYFDPSKSSTYNVINDGFNASYAQPGDWDAGNWVEETLTIGNSKPINNTIIGVALQGYDATGVWGVSFDQSEFQPTPNGSFYPSVVDRMVSQGVINRNAYSLFLNSLNATEGTVCFGCVDSTKYSGELTALPLQIGAAGFYGDGANTSKPNQFLVALSGVEFVDAAGVVTQLSTDSATYPQNALLDSGTTVQQLPNDVLAALTSGLGAIEDDSNNFIVPCSYSNTNASVKFTFGEESGGPVITVPLSEMIAGDTYTGKDFPGHSSGGCQLQVGPLLQGGAVLGDSFLRSAYVVFDLENYQVAIAQADYSQPSSSSIEIIPTGTSIPGVSSTASGSGINLSGAATASPTVSSQSGSTISVASATFNLGLSATASNATPSPLDTATASSSSSSGASAPIITAAPQALLGAVGVAALLL